MECMVSRRNLCYKCDMDDGRQKAFRQDTRYGVDGLIFWLRARQLLPFMRKKDVVVADFGSGFDALFLRRFLARRTDVRGIAVDLSLDPAIAGERLTPVVADLNQALPLPSESVDIATSLAVLEHLVRPDVHVSELYRTLRSEGTLLLTTPAPAAKPILEFIAYRLHIIDEGEIRDHKHYFNQQELRSLLIQAGFSPSRIVYHPFLFGLNQLIIATKA